MFYCKIYISGIFELVCNVSKSDFVGFSCGYTSICCLMSIAVNRLIGIVYPLQYKVRSYKIKQYCMQPWQRYFSTVPTVFIIVVCWIFAPIMLLPFLVLKNEDQTDMLGWQSSQLICTFTVNSTNVYMRVRDCYVIIT